jgi:hypothetical protein
VGGEWEGTAKEGRSGQRRVEGGGNGQDWAEVKGKVTLCNLCTQ